MFLSFSSCSGDLGALGYCSVSQLFPALHSSGQRCQMLRLGSAGASPSAGGHGPECSDEHGDQCGLHSPLPLQLLSRILGFLLLLFPVVLVSGDRCVYQHSLLVHLIHHHYVWLALPHLLVSPTGSELGPSPPHGGPVQPWSRCSCTLHQFLGCDVPCML